MAFCTNCGKELIPGQVCECQKNIMQNMQVEPSPEKVSEGAGEQEKKENGSQNPEQKNAQQSFADAKEQSVVFATNIFKLLLDILKNPVSAGRKVVEAGNAAVGIVFIVLQGIFTGLFGMVMVNKINGIIDNVGYKVSGVKDALENILSDDYKDATKAVELLKLSPSKGFIISIVGSIALSFIIALIAMLLIMAFRGKANYTSMLIVAGMRCVGMMPVTLLAVIVSFFSVWWSIVIYLISGIMGIIFLGKTITGGTDLNENRLPYVMFILVVIILIIQGFMVSKIGPLYLPDMIRGGFAPAIVELKEQLGGKSFNEIFEDILEELVRSLKRTLYDIG